MGTIRACQLAKHLPGKISRLIGDFNTIVKLCNLIEHELEKRIVARHGLVKLDSLLNLIPRLKNDIRINQFNGSNKSVEFLDKFINRLKQDYHGGNLEAGRDAMSAHALKLDLRRIYETWTFMGATTFEILRSDLTDIDSELTHICPGYVPAALGNVDSSWPLIWRSAQLLGPPEAFRLVTVYPGIATAGVVAPIAGRHPAQDSWIRAVGLATFIRQIRLLWEVVDPLSTAGRILTEIAINDLVALWELLFIGNIPNEHGAVDLSVMDHWKADNWKGTACLKKLASNPPANIDEYRYIRNKFTAHADPDVDIWDGDVERWPFKPEQLFNEALIVIEQARNCASLDIRSKLLMMPPSQMPETVLGLSGQAGKYWRDG